MRVRKPTAAGQTLNHGAELENEERAKPSSYSILSKQDRTGRVQLDDQGHQHQGEAAHSSMQTFGKGTSQSVVRNYKS